MVRLALVAVAVMLVVSAGCAFGATISISGDGMSTQVDKNYPTANCGATMQLHTAGYWDSGTNDWEYINSLWGFDLTPYVNLFGSTVTSATLQMHGWMSWSSTGGSTIGVYRVTESWTQNGATWNTRDGVNAWTTAGGTYTTNGSVVYSTGSATYETVNVTDIVQAWANGNANNGFLFKWADMNNGGDRVNDSHKVYWDNSYWPVLTINYNTPSVPEPGSLFAMFVGLTSFAGCALRRRK